MELYSYRNFCGLTLRVGCTDKYLTSLVRVDKAGEDNPTPLSELVFAQLGEYFAGTRENSIFRSGQTEANSGKGSGKRFARSPTARREAIARSPRQLVMRKPAARSGARITQIRSV